MSMFTCVLKEDSLNLEHCANYRKAEHDTRGEIHVKAVSSYQNLGPPIAGNFFYLNLTEPQTENLPESQDIHGKITYPFKNCELCDLESKWQSIGNSYLKFTIILRKVTSMKIGFAVEQNMAENTDVIIADSYGLVQDCHLQK